MESSRAEKAGKVVYMGVTMEYIARMANVSKATVSRVVNGKQSGVSEQTRLKIQSLIDEYGYTPNLAARGVSTSQSKTIGVIIPYLPNPFFPELVHSIQKQLQLLGYTVMLCDTDASVELEEQSIRTLLAKQVDGIILATTKGERQDPYEEPMKMDVPCVLVDRKSSYIDYDAGVFMDNEFASYIATKLLLSHGNRRIAFIKGPDNLSTTKERLRGYQSALEQYDIPLEKRLLLAGNFDYESGYRAVMALHEQNISFTALVSANDLMALGALQALRDIHISVPEQVEVIGCDNIQFCEMAQPALTTVRPPVEAIGKKAAEVMVELISGKKVKEKNIRFEAELIVRDSTRKG